MSDKLYDILSKIERWLPALGAFYLGICKIWGCPFGIEVNETIVCVATLLAATLEVSTVRYLKKQKDVEPEEKEQLSPSEDS